MPDLALSALVEHIRPFAQEAKVKTLREYQGEIKAAAEEARSGKVTRLPQLAPAILVTLVDSNQEGYMPYHAFEILVIARSQGGKAESAGVQSLRLARQVREHITCNPVFESDTRSYVLVESERATMPINLIHIEPSYAIYRLALTVDQMAL